MPHRRPAAHPRAVSGQLGCGLCWQDWSKCHVALITVLTGSAGMAFLHCTCGTSVATVSSCPARSFGVLPLLSRHYHAISLRWPIGSGMGATQLFLPTGRLSTEVSGELQA